VERSLTIEVAYDMVVEQLGANSVMLRLVVKTTPSQQCRASRELRERIKGRLRRGGDRDPFPQQTVWHKPAEVS
jgi:small conductance mechanosensitive channel